MINACRNVLALICATIFIMGATYASQHPASHIVDFRLFYPFISIKDPTVRISQKNYLGLSVPYLFFPTSNFGMIFEPSLSVVPVARSTTKVKYFLAGMNGGGAIRLLPDNWFDPMIQGTAGVGISDAGDLIDMTVTYPFSVRANFNLYSINDQYQDNTLALTASGSIFYIAHQLSIIKPLGYDIGLALRGSF